PSAQRPTAQRPAPTAQPSGRPHTAQLPARTAQRPAPEDQGRAAVMCGPSAQSGTDPGEVTGRSLLDGHRIDDDVLEGTVAHIGLDALDLVDDLLGVLVGDGAEHGVLALQV